MKIGIMQPYFFPYIGYFQLLNAVDKYIIYDDVNYIKGGWINRNRILINGKDNYLTLKLKDASPFKKINEIEIINTDLDKRKMLSMLEMAYRKAPYYNDVYAIIQEIIYNDETNLAKFVEFSIKKICIYLDINTTIILSSSIDKNNELKGKDKVLHICHSLGGNVYINAIGGQELYDYESFKQNGLELKFLKTNYIVYKQYNNDFISNLSIIDVMMFNSKEEIKKMLKQYEFIEE